MSTRGVVGFVADGKWYVMYNHMDSYPSELGMTVLEFCKTIDDWDDLKEKVKKIELVNDGDAPTPEQSSLYEGYASEKKSDNWYDLLRQLQNGRILYEIAVGNVKHMTDDHIFMAYSLHCEWGYVIDLDEMALHVYKGRNEEKPNPMRFNFLPDDIDPNKEEDGFYPVKLLHSYNLKKLPEFMLGVTNEFKKEYRAEHRDNLAQALNRLE